MVYIYTCTPHISHDVIIHWTKDHMWERPTNEPYKVCTRFADVWKILILSRPSPSVGVKGHVTFDYKGRGLKIEAINHHATPGEGGSESKTINSLAYSYFLPKWENMWPCSSCISCCSLPPPTFPHYSSCSHAPPFRLFSHMLHMHTVTGTLQWDQFIIQQHVFCSPQHTSQSAGGLWYLLLWGIMSHHIRLFMQGRWHCITSKTRAMHAFLSRIVVCYGAQFYLHVSVYFRMPHFTLTSKHMVLQ